MPSVTEGTAETHDFSHPPASQAHYLKNLSTYSPDASRNFAYFMVGTYSFVGAAAAKNIVADYLVHFSASADVLAMAKVEVDMAAVPEGKNAIIKVGGGPCVLLPSCWPGLRRWGRAPDH
jgi:ubiquinol-cytochrome c reductase iron-sulfur subunit